MYYASIGKMKKNKTPASVRTGPYILFKSMFYMDLCARVFIGVFGLLLVNSSNELMFAIYSIRHKTKRIYCIIKKFSFFPFMTTSFN